MVDSLFFIGIQMIVCPNCRTQKNKDIRARSSCRGTQQPAESNSNVDCSNPRRNRVSACSKTTDAARNSDYAKVYSSMSPIVHIVNIGSAMTDSVANVTEIHEGLDFSGHDDDEEDDYSFGIFSVKFSTDGRELVATTTDDSIYVYDLAANKLNVRIPAHMSDVNAVCFADEAGHVLYSRSDDHLCKVWDRRCLGKRGIESGVLTGHLEGITFIDSHGDGHYLISNGKDQSIKLWDIRKMSSNTRTRSTGQKYIYTGSADAHIYIYDMVSGAQVARLKYHDQIVRDCGWHPFDPMIGSSSWDGVIASWELKRKATYFD